MQECIQVVGHSDGFPSEGIVKGDSMSCAHPHLFNQLASLQLPNFWLKEEAFLYLIFDSKGLLLSGLQFSSLSVN